MRAPKYQQYHFVIKKCVLPFYVPLAYMISASDLYCTHTVIQLPSSTIRMTAPYKL